MRPVACFVLLSVFAMVTDGQEPPRLEVVSPAPGAYVSGVVRIEARLVPLAAEREIQRVTFFADGATVCTVVRRPYTCAWNAGAVVRAHQLRVVVELAGGVRLVRTVATKGVDVGESTGVSAVKVPATVKDGGGRFVRGLTVADFSVLEAGAPQVVTGFAAEQSDVTLALALDTSGSMERALPQVRELAKEFLRPLPGTWPAAVLAFDNSVFVISPPGSPPDERDRMIDQLKAWGGTALYNAVLRALREVESFEGRKAVVIFTDGEDRHSTVGPDEVRKAIEATDAMVYFVASGAAARNRSMMTMVEELAEISGGRVLRGGSNDDLARAFAEVREEIRNQYLLTYVPKTLAPPGTWRPLTVKVGCRGCRVRARTGYTVR